MNLVQRLAQAGSTISQICNISGVPGASIGVLHQGQVIFTDNFGYRNVASKLPPTSDTVYSIGSLTKSLVAASLAPSLLQRGDCQLDNASTRHHP